MCYSDRLRRQDSDGEQQESDDGEHLTVIYDVIAACLDVIHSLGIALIWVISIVLQVHGVSNCACVTTQFQYVVSMVVRSFKYTL